MGTNTQITNFKLVKSVQTSSLMRSCHTQCHRFHCRNTPSLAVEFQNGMKCNCCMPVESCGKRAKIMPSPAGNTARQS